jgi:hypothetical protein
MTKNEEIHVVEPSGDADRYLTRAKQLALDTYLANHGDGVTLDDFYIVWFGKGLQNWKAVIVTRDLTLGLQYEITYDGDRHQAYINEYTKTGNFVVADIPAH